MLDEFKTNGTYIKKSREISLVNSKNQRIEKYHESNTRLTNTFTNDNNEY